MCVCWGGGGGGCSCINCNYTHKRYKSGRGFKLSLNPKYSIDIKIYSQTGFLVFTIKTWLLTFFFFSFLPLSFFSSDTGMTVKTSKPRPGQNLTAIYSERRPPLPVPPPTVGMATAAKVNSRSFNVHRYSSNSLTLSNVGELFWS